jgi:uncharacterized protein YndB with AHSA1/START domain
MSSIENGRARAVADLAEGLILASVEIAAPPERVFRALVSKEVCEWWGRPGVFDTREWTGDARVGGRWRASGMDTERPYVIEGEFLAVDPPRKLVHTWHSVGAPSAPTTVTYALEPLDGATRITLRHSGFAAPFVAPGMCMNTCIGWETSFERLAELLAVGACRVLDQNLVAVFHALRPLTALLAAHLTMPAFVRAFLIRAAITSSVSPAARSRPT